MYGFSGYATNPYGSERNTFKPPIVTLAMIYLKHTYGIVVALMLKASVQLLRPALRILLEATPDDIDLEEVRQHLLELPEVQSVHDLHAWTLTSSLPILTAHVVVTDECLNTGQAGRVLDHLQDCLTGHFDVAHSTLQFETAGHIEHELGGHA